MRVTLNCFIVCHAWDFFMSWWSSYKTFFFNWRQFIVLGIFNCLLVLLWWFWICLYVYVFTHVFNILSIVIIINFFLNASLLLRRTTKYIIIQDSYNIHTTCALRKSWSTKARIAIIWARAPRVLGMRYILCMCMGGCIGFDDNVWRSHHLSLFVGVCVGHYPREVLRGG